RRRTSAASPGIRHRAARLECAMLHGEEPHLCYPEMIEAMPASAPDDPAEACAGPAGGTSPVDLHPSQWQKCIPPPVLRPSRHAVCRIACREPRGTLRRVPASPAVSRPQIRAAARALSAYVPRPIGSRCDGHLDHDRRETWAKVGVALPHFL